MSQSWGGSALRTSTGGHNACQGPRIRMPGVQPRLRPPGEKRKPSEGNAVHRLESSRLRPRKRTAVPPPPPARRAGARTKWRSRTALSGQLPAGARQAYPGGVPTCGVGNGPGRAPRREWAGPFSRKCLRLRRGARGGSCSAVWARREGSGIPLRSPCRAVRARVRACAGGGTQLGQ